MNFITSAILISQYPFSRKIISNYIDEIITQSRISRVMKLFIGHDELKRRYYIIKYIYSILEC